MRQGKKRIKEKMREGFVVHKVKKERWQELVKGVSERNAVTKNESGI